MENCTITIPTVRVCTCVCVCVFIKLHITAQSGPPCHPSHYMTLALILLSKGDQ